MVRLSLQAGQVARLTCSTRAECIAFLQSGRDLLFSSNSLAFAALAGDYPLRFNISISATVGGYVVRAKRAGRKLTHKYLDDSVIFKNGGSILPVGASHGYKSTTLSAMLEALILTVFYFPAVCIVISWISKVPGIDFR